jgi:hypothetical protein
MTGKKPEIAVFAVTREATCAECRVTLHRGSLLRKEGDQLLCMECADMAHLVFLPRGDAALTRRTTKHMPAKFVVLKWSRARKRHERQGILATNSAIERAERECLSDADARRRMRERAAARRETQDAAYQAEFARAVRREFPSCPPAEEEEIAAHACRKYSGRVGRSAAAKRLDPEAVALAVVAHVRHVHTAYDVLLARHDDRQEARRAVQPQVDTILAGWRAPTPRG